MKNVCSPEIEMQLNFKSLFSNLFQHKICFTQFLDLKLKVGDNSKQFIPNIFK